MSCEIALEDMPAVTEHAKCAPHTGGTSRRTANRATHHVIQVIFIIPTPWHGKKIRPNSVNTAIYWHPLKLKSNTKRSSVDRLNHPPRFDDVPSILRKAGLAKLGESPLSFLLSW
ncbi:hypothetical protein EVAR_25778_1 [Eumeta japonica]|uniref:Uncharacterized protein n=1 Tax=Eumeta variegata TaxID=151549 RepID=A0A4C1VTX3_EUMVA|nr:hypothetical protein EVAR_25778_1 [Eumeta japonica]